MAVEKCCKCKFDGYTNREEGTLKPRWVDNVKLTRSELSHLAETVKKVCQAKGCFLTRQNSVLIVSANVKQMEMSQTVF